MQSYQRFQHIVHTDFNTSGTNTPRSFSQTKAGYTLGFRKKIAHKGTHGETRGVSDGVVSLPSVRSARSQISPGRVSEQQTLPLLGLGLVCSQRTQRACGTAMRMMRVAVPQASRPRWAACSFPFLSKVMALRPALRAFYACAVGMVSLLSACFACF